MNYHDDPNLNRRPANRPSDRDETSYTPWIVGALVAIAVIIGIFAMSNRTDKNATATNSIPPSASTTAPAPSATPPATTGSATTSEPAPAPAAR